MREYFNVKEALKRVFFFPDDDRTLLLQEAKIDSVINLPVKDKNGEVFEVPLRVTRNTHLGRKTRWIYGEVLNLPGVYHQIEIKLHKGEPRCDTIEVFLQAPPSIVNKLR